MTLNQRNKTWGAGFNNITVKRFQKKKKKKKKQLYMSRLELSFCDACTVFVRKMIYTQLSRKKIVYLFLTKFVRTEWLDIGLVQFSLFFLRVYQ